MTDLQFLAEHFGWSMKDLHGMTWRMRKELIQFHIDVLEERRRKDGK